MSVTLVALYFASPASAVCGLVIYDFTPGLHAVSCSYGPSPEETWTVPLKATKPTFMIWGADDPIGGKTGGLVKAKLPVKAGQALNLKIGGGGASTSVSRGGVPLLVAGGGNGIEPNYLDVEAMPLEIKAPGLPVGSSAGNGWAFIEWYDARDPFELTHSLGYVIADIFDGDKVSFSHTGTAQTWEVPAGVKFALFELFGGEGESGEPRGHILAGFEVDPGETFYLWVGGNGGDTTLARSGSFQVGVAAGGDTERPNYLPWGSSRAEAFWEGGGMESKLGEGYAIVHFWRSEDPPRADPLPVDLLPKDYSPGPTSSACIVPALRNKRHRAARHALRNANCALNRVAHRSTHKGMRGRILSQKPPAGTVAAAGSGVAVVVGSR